MRKPHRFLCYVFVWFYGPDRIVFKFFDKFSFVFLFNRYVALYTYKPTKDDELELVKNENYCVTDKCKDGWFKGYSVSTQKRGVFPGNYVRLAR